MKKLFATATALSFAIAAPAFAEKLSPEEVEELLALSNSSAAERMVGETSEGNPMLAEMKFALGEMSAAERRAFFEADEETRTELLSAKLKLRDGDSPAETAAIGSTTITN